MLRLHHQFKFSDEFVQLMLISSIADGGFDSYSSQIHVYSFFRNNRSWHFWIFLSFHHAWQTYKIIVIIFRENYWHTYVFILQKQAVSGISV